MWAIYKAKVISQILRRVNYNYTWKVTHNGMNTFFTINLNIFLVAKGSSILTRDIDS